MNKRSTGAKYEQLAADHLRSHGARIIETNFRCRSGEVDLIFRDHETLVFAEVKYRTNSRYGCASEAVTPQKQQTIVRVGSFYLMRYGFSTDTPVRFDVIAIDAEEDGQLRINWIKDAFRANL